VVKGVVFGKWGLRYGVEEYLTFLVDYSAWRFHKILILSLILKFPLTTVPLSLAHVNGVRHTSMKSALMNHLQGDSDKTPPDVIDVTL
jgi:hypothetical protein